MSANDERFDGGHERGGRGGRGPGHGRGRGEHGHGGHGHGGHGHGFGPGRGGFGFGFGDFDAHPGRPDRGGPGFDPGFSHGFDHGEDHDRGGPGFGFGPRMGRGGGGRFGRGGFPGMPGMPGMPPMPPMPPGPPDFFGGHRRGGRQRRGNVRAAVIALLAERPMHGYEMIQEIGQRTDGLWRPSPGSVYPTLQLLADEGLVVAAEEQGGKKLFQLTESGRTEAESAEGVPPWEQVTDGVDQGEARLREAAKQIGAAMMQMVHAGTEDQQRRAAELLDETRRKLYAILGESPEED
ncbi:PadR family transcriptional regulator [Actinosynnema pretiosum]|uniref:PadR family transcriptional regulator n=1 Tax=Actinosynnema pretiosum TaxID=42197 RepID=A0A290ZCQ5_9PSEU|nr:PadR family transcriptional regulator [Actinosynnema pretiosum]ATE56821.1 PadR family transcriptional regulator [Actinosynnema pretiosum]